MLVFAGAIVVGCVVGVASIVGEVEPGTAATSAPAGEAAAFRKSVAPSLPSVVEHVAQARVASPEGQAPAESAAEADDEAYAQSLTSAPLPEIGVLNPLQGAAITREEAQALHSLYEEGTKRQRELDRQEQEGLITPEEHARLSKELDDEMNRRMAEILSPERFDIFVELAQQYAIEYMKQVTPPEELTGQEVTHGE